MNDILKTGACSIVLGENYYSDYFEIVENKLLKVSKIIDTHNEFKYISNIKKINNYNKYYSLPDEVKTVLKPSDSFYIFLEGLVDEKDIFDGTNLYYFYVDYAGDKDLTEIIYQYNNFQYENYWKSYSSILDFTKHIMEGIKYLHINKICHLDIKPENIIVNTINNTSKIIDFGFSSIEPFDDYVFNIRGTPGYFPKYFAGDILHENVPLVDANDMILINNEIPMVKDRSLVYKIDSYCFGRVLIYLKKIYEINQNISHSLYFWKTNKNEKKLKKIISLLLESKVENRITITECYEMFFNQKN
jgi:serine/threonine protein kinase